MKFKSLIAFASGILVPFSFVPPVAADTDWGEIIKLTVEVVDAVHESDTEKKEKLHAVQNQESLIAGKWQNSAYAEDDIYLLIGSNNRCANVYIKGSSSDYYRDSNDCNYYKFGDTGYFNYDIKGDKSLFSVEWINKDEFKTEVISSPNSENVGNKSTWTRLDREVTASYRERQTTTATTTRRSTNYSRSSSSSRSYTPRRTTYTPPKTVDYTEKGR